MGKKAMHILFGINIGIHYLLINKNCCRFIFKCPHYCWFPLEIIIGQWHRSRGRVLREVSQKGSDVKEVLTQSIVKGPQTNWSACVSGQ